MQRLRKKFSICVPPKPATRRARRRQQTPQRWGRNDSTSRLKFSIGPMRTSVWRMRPGYDRRRQTCTTRWLRFAQAVILKQFITHRNALTSTVFQTKKEAVEHNSQLGAKWTERLQAETEALRCANEEAQTDLYAKLDQSTAALQEALAKVRS